MAPLWYIEGLKLRNKLHTININMISSTSMSSSNIASRDYIFMFWLTVLIVQYSNLFGYFFNLRGCA